MTLKKDRYFNEETGPSKAAREHPDWEPEWISERFVGLLECSLPACGELAAVSGKCSIEHLQVDWDKWSTTRVFIVQSLCPAPIPISQPSATPEPISQAIAKAALLVWSSPESAANQIRQAVEALMNATGIPSKSENGKTIALHDRIEAFKKNDQENGDTLLATKWLGNSGSHVGGVSREDVLDAFDMIEFVLENRYGTIKAELMAKVAAINAAKGPVKSA